MIHYGKRGSIHAIQKDANALLFLRIDRFVASNQAGHDLTEILRRLTICKRPECAKKFTGNNCKKYNKGCGTTRRWFRMLIGDTEGKEMPAPDCEKWVIQ